MAATPRADVPLAAPLQSLRRRGLLLSGSALLISRMESAMASTPDMDGWPRPTQAKPSVTYLHLLAKTPFFTALDKSQLQWAIDHSREWSVARGSEISSSTLGPDNFWVLRDGGWQIEHGGAPIRAGHADPAKWYGGAGLHALGRGSKLVAAASSYVMHIRQADLEEMLRRGFAFDRHLQDGLAFYTHHLQA